MKYCTTCLQPDTRPNTIFTNEGLCPACNYFNNTRDIDWDDRFKILTSIISKIDRKPGQYFDCIIGVSGGKDSTRQALWVRDKLGLKPLLVGLMYPPEQVTERGVNNISNLIELGFDVVLSSLSPQMWKKTLYDGFFQFTNWSKATEQAILASVPQLAIKYNIPLIFWGENPGLQLGDLKTIGKTGYDGNNLKYMNTVSGGGLDGLLKSGLDRKKLNPYLYPNDIDFKKNKIEIIYLGWFWEDWSIVNNGVYSVLDGLETRSDSVENTGDLHGIFSLDEDWVTLNQMIKYYKFGFGRVSDYANEGIRMGEMTREQGIELVEKYDDACGSGYIKSFCAYIEITVEEFWDQVHKNVNKELFTIKSDGLIQRNFKVGIGL